MMPLRLHRDLEVLPSKGMRLSDLDPALRGLLNHLRMVSLQCRSAARTDLLEACRILSSSPDVARNAHAEMLMKCLSQALEKPPLLFRPGVEEVSFDESWLLRATLVVANKDFDSFRFLLASRVPSHARRNLGFLIIGVSEQFCLV
ncbi:hypothetical protein [Puniceibacterium sediminis]|uniref:Uncharacterized protein n=1 Tax=Puniceibacterium sediminis TaxID=1608407 RepID=A0A238YQ49_9RHOB|nr:hypothetical protein [Puniceibacterium sediminis]SNR73396.1 hypothetical protein SAMN06265370_11943 [Puniceibacterium sediminis]